MKPERTLWQGALADGTTLVVTRNFGRIMDNADTVREWAWVNYASGRWDGEEGLFVATAISDDVEDLHLQFAKEADLGIGLVISDRIESSIVYQETALIGDAAWVRVFVRRNPDGTLFTQSLGFGIDHIDPEYLEKVVYDLEQTARGAVGMPEV